MYLDVRSADGNYVQNQAVKRNQFYVPAKVAWSSNSSFPRLSDVFLEGIREDAPYHAFRLSCINLFNAWHGARHAIAYGVPRDLEDITRIARQWSKELGFVRKVALLEAMQRFEVFVAFLGDQLLGFVNWHQRRDGWATIYEIAVRRDAIKCGIGRALLHAVPKPLRLKCPVDNASNRFYEHVGLTYCGQEVGRKRALNLWQYAA